ncbi:hypothetical protein EJ069_10295 [Mesorhizobium sp. M2A.F.Ca.ET.043.05.1.1]|uniref:hypothetical protein n=1 Tax=Mesorhizobium sp. M2A.F.Ca.ET.043.05.1.1 TaxID=2493671 RepID=UPI000F74F87B|nr:hypothetical protein [Mesorhizobium sp. M2A.F.Ca.ET.043.05.1.1]AZO15084.1 hypothetical protein EJ069_10295 [Mesorhizobium sp. M2A.F.Ca.ET.043.05.1.1]
MPYRLEGFASLPVRDAEDHLVALKSLSWNAPKLLYRHDDKVVAGKIVSLKWRDQGLWIECDAEDQYAESPAFSIRFSVREHEIKGVGREAHAIVKRGILTEVSLVQTPCCPGALVVHRHKLPDTPITKSTNPFNDAEWQVRHEQRQIKIKTLLSEMKGGN